jgi:hypothetical protein
MRAAHPNQSMFMETAGSNNDDQFIGEDIVFFRKMKAAGIPLHAHTGALVRHIKRFSLDVDYYSMYWTMVQMQEQNRLQQEAQQKQQG